MTKSTKLKCSQKCELLASTLDSKVRTVHGFHGHVVTKSCRWISSRYYVFLLHKEHTNAESVPPRIIC